MNQKPGCSKRGCGIFLLICVLIIVGVILHDIHVAHVLEKEAETATGMQDTTGILDDYDRQIFGGFRFLRGSSVGQSIYDSSGYNNRNDIPPDAFLVSGGKIEKFMHDSSRFIAYHMTEKIVIKIKDGVEQYGDGEQFYAILDTQTKQIERFADIVELSNTILERQIHFSNWYYTAALNSLEGVRTPLVGEYSFERIGSAYGQSILQREIPIFFGRIEDVQTDGKRYITFRLRIINDDLTPWYNDPVTNTLLQAPSTKSIGLYRRGFLDWYSVFYDQYVLFDTQGNTVQEFNKASEIESFCASEKISLRSVEIRKQ